MAMTVTSPQQDQQQQTMATLSNKRASTATATTTATEGEEKSVPTTNVDNVDDTTATTTTTTTATTTVSQPPVSPPRSSSRALSPIQRFMKELQRASLAKSVEIVQDNPRLDLNLMVGRRSLLRRTLSARSVPRNMTFSGMDREEQLREKRDRRWAGLTSEGGSGDGTAGARPGAMSGKSRSSSSLSSSAKSNTKSSSISPVCPKRRASTERRDFDEEDDDFMSELELVRALEEQQRLLDERWGALSPMPNRGSLTRSVSCDGKLQYSKQDERMDNRNEEMAFAAATTEPGINQLSGRRRQLRRGTINAPDSHERPSWGTDSLPEYDTALHAIQARYAKGSSVSPPPAPSACAPSIPIRRGSVECLMAPEQMRADLGLQDKEEQ